MKKYLSLKASAGSGKTFALTVRYISLLFLGAKPKEILTLTFTNKASNEMSDRILKTLYTLGSDKIYLDEISKVTSFSKDKLLKEKSKVLESFINSEISIMTIDKFVNKVLREFCGYLGISDDFNISNDDIDDMGYKYLNSIDLETFDKLLELSFYEGKKFGTFLGLFKYLLEKNEDYKSIKIDKEIIPLQKERIVELANELKLELLKNKELSTSGVKALDFDDFESLLDKSKTWIIKDCISEYSYFKKVANETSKDIFYRLKIEVSNYYKLRSNYSLNLIIELLKDFKTFKHEYNKSLNQLEFADVSNMVYELLSNYVDREFLYFRLDSKYQHILIDEFQDTSILQYKILKPMIDEVLANAEGSFKTFFYVGDIKQSIYRFRGGNKALFDYVCSSSPLILTEKLRVNYRSCKNIIDFVNEKFLSLGNYEYDEQLSIKDGGFVKVIEDENISQEDFSILKEEIETILSMGESQNSIAILTYTNSDVMSIYEYLSKNLNGVKISTEMTLKLINQDSVKAVINLIKYLYFGENIYRANFNAILSRRLMEEICFNIDLLNQGVPEIIKQIAYAFDIVDENIIKFIETSSKYKNIIEFVYEIDKNEEIVASKEKSGIEILTLFKSKGLEYDTVFVLDRIKRKNADKSSILFDYENIELKNIYYKLANYENFNIDYKEALEKEKRLVYEDELNVLYVALTRAKKSLFVIKKQKSSVFDLINLAPCEIGNFVVSKDKNDKEIQKEKIDYIPLNLGKQNSKIKDKELDEQSSIEARYYGIATHYMLEMLPEFDIKYLEYSFNLLKNRYSNYLNENSLFDIKKRVANLLQNSQFLELIDSSKFSKEQSIIYNKELRIIDLLSFKDEKYYIYDYKTTTEVKVEHYEQVRAYKKAIKDIFQTDNVSGYLIYLKSDEVLLKEVSN